MKINADYDGKRIRMEAEVPPEDLKKFLARIGDFVGKLFEEEKKVGGPKKGHPKKEGGS
jgi:uncharacterized FlaG/YvyC family protein